jgi:hypothetical protein
LVIPGGKIFDLLLKENFDQSDYEIINEISRVIREFHALKKPIFLTSNSSILACKVLGKKNLGQGLTLTFGSENIEWKNKDYVKFALDSGNTHKPREEDSHYVDVKNSIITVPGGLKNNPDLSALFNSIEKGIMAIYNHIKYLKH